MNERQVLQAAKRYGVRRTRKAGDLVNSDIRSYFEPRVREPFAIRRMNTSPQSFMLLFRTKYPSPADAKEHGRRLAQRIGTVPFGNIRVLSGSQSGGFIPVIGLYVRNQRR